MLSLSSIKQAFLELPQDPWVRLAATVRLVASIYEPLKEQFESTQTKSIIKLAFEIVGHSFEMVNMPFQETLAKLIQDQKITTEELARFMEARQFVLRHLEYLQKTAVKKKHSKLII